MNRWEEERWLVTGDYRHTLEMKSPVLGCLIMFVSSPCFISKVVFPLPRYFIMYIALTQPLNRGKSTKRKTTSVYLATQHFSWWFLVFRIQGERYAIMTVITFIGKRRESTQLCCLPYLLTGVSVMISSSRSSSRQTCYEQQWLCVTGHLVKIWLCCGQPHLHIEWSSFDEVGLWTIAYPHWADFDWLEHQFRPVLPGS